MIVVENVDMRSGGNKARSILNYNCKRLVNTIVEDDNSDE